MTNPVPTDDTPQVAAETLNVLASAAAAIARAAGSVGRSTGGAGSGSKPTKTSGSPVASSRSPRPPATSVAGGRTAAIVRTAVDPPAVSARRGIGPSASEAAGQPDDEQRLGDRRGRAGGPVGGAQQAVTEPAGQPRARAPPRATRRGRPRPTRPARTTIGRIVGSMPDSGSCEVGQGEDGDRAAQRSRRSGRRPGGSLPSASRG